MNSTATLSNETTSTPNLTPDAPGDYTIELTIENTNGSSDTDSVTITALDLTEPTGTFGVSANADGPFLSDGSEEGSITSPDDPRIIDVAPGGTFYAQVAYSDPGGIADIVIVLRNTSPEGLFGTLNPNQQFFTLGDPVGDCDLSGSQTSVTCTYPITVADDAVNIDELDGADSREFAYIFRAEVIDSSGNASDFSSRGYVMVEASNGSN